MKKKSTKKLLIIIGCIIGLLMLATIFLTLSLSGVFGENISSAAESLLFGNRTDETLTDDAPSSSEPAKEPIKITAGEECTYIGIETLCCYDSPGDGGEVIYNLTSGEQIQVLSADDGYVYFLSPLGYCYAPSDMFLPGKAYAYVEGAVDLRGYIPEAIFDLDFASENNITGRSLYPPIPLIEETTAEMLLEAYEIFKADGYIMKICDVYRPVSSQQALFNKVGDNAFIADPSKGGSWHNSGRAIDMTLIDEYTGLELEMPTEMHTLNYSAARSNHTTWSEEVQENVEYMTRVMTSLGFTTIDSEWWHFENRGEGGYMDRELDYSTIEYRVK